MNLLVCFYHFFLSFAAVVQQHMKLAVNSRKEFADSYYCKRTIISDAWWKVKAPGFVFSCKAGDHQQTCRHISKLRQIPLTGTLQSQGARLREVRGKGVYPYMVTNIQARVTQYKFHHLSYLREARFTRQKS